MPIKKLKINFESSCSVEKFSSIDLQVDFYLEVQVDLGRI